MRFSATSSLLLLACGLACADGLVPTQIHSQAAGGTGVVTAEGSDALFANPACLGLDGSDVGTGDLRARDTVGWELSGTLLMRNPGKLASEVLDHWSTLKLRNLDTALARDPGFFDVLQNFNRQAVDFRPELRADWHGHGYGASVWGIGDFGVVSRPGELYPSGSVMDTLSLGTQLGMSQTLIRNELMVGVAVKSIWATSWGATASSRSPIAVRDTLIAQAREEFGLEHVEWVVGTDLGVLWLPVPQVQLGTSFRDLGMWYRGDFLMPGWDLGAAWYPQPFQLVGSDMPGRLSLAVALIDLLDGRHGWKPLSKLALGSEYAFSPLPWKTFNVRLAIGALGGYPTAGIGLDVLRALHLDLATWAREGGWYTGQLPDRKWAFKAGLGW